MPPRYSYWTIIIDDMPTAFRAGSLEEITPTFNRLKAKQPTAKLMWFQGGQLWPSRIDARVAMDAKAAARSTRSSAPRSAFRDTVPARTERPAGARDERPEWKPRGAGAKPAWQPKSPDSSPKPWTKPAGARAFKPAAKPWAKPEGERGERPEWKPRPQDSGPKPWTKPAGARAFKPAAKPWAKPEGERGERPEWKPKETAFTPPAARPRSHGAESTEAPRSAPPRRSPTPKKGDKNWRPGGDHKDPRQKFKDAKKAKWTRFKQAIRTRHDKKATKDH